MSDNIFVNGDINDIFSTVESEKIEMPKWLNVIDQNSDLTSDLELSQLNNLDNLSETSAVKKMNSETSAVDNRFIENLSATSLDINDIFISQNGGNVDKNLASPDDINNLINMLTSEKVNTDFETITTITNTEVLENQLKDLLNGENKSEDKKEQEGGAKKASKKSKKASKKSKKASKKSKKVSKKSKKASKGGKKASKKASKKSSKKVSKKKSKKSKKSSKGGKKIAKKSSKKSKKASKKSSKKPSKKPSKKSSKKTKGGKKSSKKSKKASKKKSTKKSKKSRKYKGAHGEDHAEPVVAEVVAEDVAEPEAEVVVEEKVEVEKKVEEKKPEKKSGGNPGFNAFQELKKFVAEKLGIPAAVKAVKIASMAKKEFSEGKEMTAVEASEGAKKYFEDNIEKFKKELEKM